MSCEVMLPTVAVRAHKYTRGKLVVVAGSARYPGAAVLAACAAQRMGVGYTEVITDERALDAVRAASPSLVVRPFSQWEPSEIPEASAQRPCAVCLGPGFAGDDPKEEELVEAVLAAAACPVLVDGGALSHLCEPKARAVFAARVGRGRSTVVTPHGGEAARLAQAWGLERAGQEGSDEFASALSQALGCVVVLKGPDTFIADDEQVVSMFEGTPALAKAGTGDVLAGMVGALLAQGFAPMTAAYTGATLHARAGSLAADDLTEIAVVAEDVIAYIPAALKASGAGG